MLHYLRSKGLKNSFTTLLAEAKQHWKISEPSPGSLRDLGAILQDYLRLRAEKLQNALALRDSGLHKETLDFMEKLSVLVQDYAIVKERALERVSSNEYSDRRVRISSSNGPINGSGNELDHNTSNSGAGTTSIHNGSASAGVHTSSGYPGKKKVSAGAQNVPLSQMHGSSDTKSSSSASLSEVVGSMTAQLKQRNGKQQQHQQVSSGAHSKQQQPHKSRSNNGFTGSSHSMSDGESFSSLGHTLNSSSASYMSSRNLPPTSNNNPSSSMNNGGNNHNLQSGGNGSGDVSSNKHLRQRSQEDMAAPSLPGSNSMSNIGASGGHNGGDSTPTMTPRRSRSGRPIRPPLMSDQTPPTKANLSHSVLSSSKPSHLNDSLTFSNISFSNASPIEKDCSTSRIRMTPLHDHELSLGPLENTSGSPIFTFDFDNGRTSRSVLAPGDESLGSILDGNSLLGRSNISQILREDSSFNTGLDGNQTHSVAPLNVTEALRAATAGLNSVSQSTPQKLVGPKSAASHHRKKSDHSKDELDSSSSARRKRRITPSCISPNVNNSPPPSSSSSTSSNSNNTQAKRRKTSTSFRSPMSTASNSSRSRRGPSGSPMPTKAGGPACGSAAGDKLAVGVDVDSFLSKVAYN